MNYPTYSGQTVTRRINKVIDFQIHVPTAQAAEDAIAECRNLDREFYGQRHNAHISYGYAPALHEETEPGE